MKIVFILLTLSLLVLHNIGFKTVYKVAKHLDHFVDGDNNIKTGDQNVLPSKLFSPQSLRGTMTIKRLSILNITIFSTNAAYLLVHDISFCLYSHFDMPFTFNF